MTKEEEILSRRQYGDIRTAASMLGKTTEACRTALNRKDSKGYKELVAALVVVIQTRETLLKK